MLITINSTTNGKFQKKRINGREHIITKIMPIRGDTAMNRIMYPNAEVQKSFTQLNNLIAPSSHPVVNGQNVSAYHPLAINANNIGAFLKNPKMKGKEVIAEFVIDVDVANQSDDGKETIRRIEANEQVAVSTGLTINQLTPKTGKDDFGKDYDHVGNGFQFDHVAVLLNEEAAGAHAGTQLVTNNDIAGKDKEVSIINLNKMMVVNELSVRELRDQLEVLISPTTDKTWSWICEIFPDSRTIFYKIDQSGQPEQAFKQSYAVDDSDTVSLLDDRKQVERKVEFVEVTNQQEVDDMDKEKLVLALITNGLTSKTKDELMAMSESDLAALVQKPITEDQAREVLTNSGFDFAGYENFQANAESFKSFQESEAERLGKIREEIVTNSDYTPELLEGKSEAELLILQKTVSTKPTPRIGHGVVNSTTPSESVTCDYTF